MKLMELRTWADRGWAGWTSIGTEFVPAIQEAGSMRRTARMRRVLCRYHDDYLFLW
jgi:hypothetical protein